MAWTKSGDLRSLPRPRLRCSHRLALTDIYDLETWSKVIYDNIEMEYEERSMLWSPHYPALHFFTCYEPGGMNFVDHNLLTWKCSGDQDHMHS